MQTSVQCDYQPSKLQKSYTHVVARAALQGQFGAREIPSGEINLTDRGEGESSSQPQSAIKVN